MATLTGEALQLRAQQALAVPLAAALGVSLLDVDDPTAGVAFTVATLADNGAGGAHAAALAAVLELAGYLALLPQLDVEEHALTTASAMQLIAPAPAGQVVEVRATADPRTRRVAFVSAFAACGSVVVARSQLTKAIVGMHRPGGGWAGRLGTEGGDMSDEAARRQAVTDFIAGNSFCTLATSSAGNRPHVAGVLYALAGRDLYISTDKSSRKARNVAENERVAVCVLRQVDGQAPPFTASLQGTAALLENDDPEIVGLVADGRLTAVTSHGELERPGTCFIKVSPGRRVATYGVGVSEEELAADPLSAFESFEW
jgi:acyl-coenzyme A thioesterase PaaI-like protein/nitroimidazol reductase NimA-like FMN-containing flavoprotein (pyridoxamine 5'-phosphate oxidase superfamily)